MTNHDITGRADLDALLQAFYGAALRDELLGPVFASAGLDLATHLPRIETFWEVTLLGTGEYFGRPMRFTGTSLTPPVWPPLTSSDGLPCGRRRR